MANNGIYFINDIIDENGDILSCKDCNEKYNTAINPFHYMSLIHAIPKTWKNTLKVDFHKKEVKHGNIQYLKTHEKVTKSCYSLFLKIVAEKPFKNRKPSIRNLKAKWMKIFGNKYINRLS